MIKTLLARAGLIFFIALSILLLPGSINQVLADDTDLNSSDLGALNEGYPYFDPDAENACETSNGVVVTGNSKFLSGDPLTLKAPQITDEAAYGAAMVAFIRAHSPGSPWLNIPDLGAKLVAAGKQRDVNMMMIVTIANQESNIGTSTVATDNKNSFGNKGNGPHGYRTWPSFEASLTADDSFTQTVHDNINGVGVSNYKNVTSVYEYISVHVSGQIIYPGDKTVVHDELMNQDVNDSAVLTYWNHVRDWIAEMTGFVINGVPTRPNGSASDISCDSASGSGPISVEGYFFPIAPATKKNYSTLPCQGDRGYRGNYTDRYGTTTRIQTCHHDATPAFDLMFGGNHDMDGLPIYAITDGTIASVGTNYGGVSGCTEIQFHSSKDNMYYWYGHMQNPKVHAGQTVKGGQQIAEDGRYALGSACWGGRTHLHIDRGCKDKSGTPHQAGYDDCRDPAFLTLMQKIWEALPAP